jgi:hypothetical protein
MGNFPASIPLEVVFSVPLMYLPHFDILNCFFFILTSVVSLTHIGHNVSTDIFNLTDVWKTWIGVIQEQLDVTICPPPLQERSAMLYKTDHCVLLILKFEITFMSLYIPAFSVSSIPGVSSLPNSVSVP